MGVEIPEKNVALMLLLLPSGTVHRCNWCREKMTLSHGGYDVVFPLLSNCLGAEYRCRV